MQKDLKEFIIPEWARLKIISWKAIIAGTVAAISVGLLLNTLGIGIGLAAFTTSESGALTYAISGILWLIISTFIAMTIGGLVVGMLVRTDYKSFGGALHGFLVWGLSSILLFLLTSMVIIPTVAEIAHGAASNPALINQAQADSRPASHVMVTYNSRTDTKTISTSVNTQKSLNFAGGFSLLFFFASLMGLIGAIIGAKVGVKDYFDHQHNPEFKRD